MGKKINYESFIGQKIDCLTIKEYIGKEKQSHKFKCSCDCGNESVIKSYNFLFGKTNSKCKKSCGCKSKDTILKFNRKKSSFLNMECKKIKEDYYELTAFRYPKKFKVILDEYGYKTLKDLNRTVTIDSRGYPFITLPNERKQIFLMNLFKLGISKCNKTILIDHKNNNRCDCRLCNLRESNLAQNAQNAKIRQDNTTGIKGLTIIRSKTRPRWLINIRIQCTKNRIGVRLPFSKEGFKLSIIWDIQNRINLHKDFSNFGIEIKNKTYNEIIQEMYDIFLSNLNDYDLKVFNNNGYERESLKNKKNKTFETLKKQYENIDLDKVVVNE